MSSLKTGALSKLLKDKVSGNDSFAPPQIPNKPPVPRPSTNKSPPSSPPSSIPPSPTILSPLAPSTSNPSLTTKSPPSTPPPTSVLSVPQSSSTVLPAGGSSPEEEKRLRLRDKAVKEVLDTERSYVKSLNTLVEGYIKPLTDLSNSKESPLTRDDLDVLFNEINLIIQLNQRFLEKLESRHKDWNHDSSLLGDIFLEYAPFFKMYTQYVINHDKASQLIQSLLNNQKFQTIMEELERSPKADGHRLSDYLIMPIQRIPRYRLLLQELLRHTLEKHPDYEKLKKALLEIGGVADHVNEGIALVQKQAELVRIQQMFSGNPDLVGPGRTFLYQGTLNVKAHDGDKKMEFFLFNDMLIYAARTVTGLFKARFSCKINKGFEVQDLEDNADRRNAIYIINPLASFIAETPDLASKKVWLSQIRSAMGEQVKATQRKSHRRKSSHYEAAPMWQSDASSNKCAVCNKAWSILRRRHHCRHCGALVCDQCSPQRLMLESRQHKDPQRVCSNCVVTLTRKNTVTSSESVSSVNNGSVSKEGVTKDEKHVDTIEELGAPIVSASVPHHVARKHRRVGSQLSDEQIAQLNELSDDEDDGGLVMIDDLGSTPSVSSPSVLLQGFEGDTPGHGARRGLLKKPVAPSTSAPAPSPAVTGSSQWGRALWDFESTDVQDLNFKEGDILKLQSSEGNWWKGFVANNPEKIGLFPKNHVELLSDNAPEVLALQKQLGDASYVNNNPFLPTTSPPPSTTTSLLTQLLTSPSASSSNSSTAPVSTSISTSISSPSISHPPPASKVTSSTSTSTSHLESEIDRLKRDLEYANAKISMIESDKAQKVLQYESEKKAWELQNSISAKLLEEQNKKIEELEKKLSGSESPKNKVTGESGSISDNETEKKLRQQLTDLAARYQALREKEGDSDLRKENEDLKNNIELLTREAEISSKEIEKLKKAVTSGNRQAIDVLLAAVNTLREESQFEDVDDEDEEFLVSSASGTPTSPTPASPLFSSQSSTAPTTTRSLSPTPPRSTVGPRASSPSVPMARSSVTSPVKRPSLMTASSVKSASDREKERAKALGNSGYGAPLSLSPRGKTTGDDWTADATQLAKGIQMTKLPRWGNAKQTTFTLVKRVRKRPIGDKKVEPAPVLHGEWRMPETDRKAEGAEETFYCLEWTSAKGSNRVLLDHEVQVTFGQRMGQFLKPKFKKQFTDQEKRSVSLVTRDRTIDLVCPDPSDSQRFQNVLRHLYSEKVI